MLTGREITDNSSFPLTDRVRIHELLEDVAKDPLIIVSAGSGSGKTVAVSCFVARSQEQVVWVHLTHLDTHSTRFWSLFAGAVEPWNTVLARQLRSMPFPATVPAMCRFLELFRTEMESVGHVILVMDNFHLLREGPVKHFIEQIIQEQIPNLSVILIAQQDLHIRLPDTVHPTHISEKQLSFTREEIRVYYTALGIVMDHRELDIIYSLTGGWAAAVYMLGLHLHKNVPVTDESIDNSLSFLFRMFEDELYAPLPTSLQRALVLLSLINAFTLEMAVVLTDVAEDVLLEHIGANPFVSHSADSGQYSFHTLFLDFLQGKQQMIRKNSRNAYLRKAARWFLERRQIYKSIRCLVESASWKELDRVLVQYDIFSFKPDSAQACLRELEKVPQDAQLRYPLLRLHIALIAFEARHEDQTERMLLDMLQDLRGHSGDLERRALGEACIMLAYLSRRRGSLRFVGQLKEAYSLLPEGSHLLDGRHSLFLGNGNAMPFPGAESGALAQMLAAVFQAVPYMGRLFQGFGAGHEYLAAAECSYYQNSLQKARAEVEQALSITVARCQWDIACNAHYLAMRIDIAEECLDGVLQRLEDIDECGGRVREYDYFALPDIARSSFYMKMGQSSRIASWISRDNVSYAAYLHLHSGRELVMRASYLIATQKYYPALAFIQTGMLQCRETGQWFSLIKLYILQALAYYAIGQYGVASKSLQEVYKMTHANNIIMPFIESGGSMVNLIKHLMSARGVNIPSSWLHMVYEETRHYSKSINRMRRAYLRQTSHGANLLDMLTARELEALKLLSKGLTNEEIARQMVIEPSSVRLMLTRVYTKIQAANRTDAVRIAFEHGINDTVHPTSQENAGLQF